MTEIQNLIDLREKVRKDVLNGMSIIEKINIEIKYLKDLKDETKTDPA